MISKDAVPFKLEEYRRRWSIVRARMSEHGLDALLVTGASEITYLTGYDANTSYVPQVVLLSANEPRPMAFMRPMDVSGMLHTSHLEESEIISYPESLIGGGDPTPYDFIVDQLAAKGLSTSRLGIELDTISVATHQQLSRRLTQASLVDSRNLIGLVRMVKSEPELDYLRQAARIADGAILRARDVVRPGVRQCDAAAEIAAALCRGTNDISGHRIESLPLMPSGTRVGSAHLSWTDGAYSDGESINIELGAMRYRYVAAVMRTLSLGKPSDRLQKLHDATVAGMEAAVARFKPGNTCDDVASAFHRAINSRGFRKDSRCGYSIGINWLETAASLRVGDRTVIQPGMAFHMMLGNWLEHDFGCAFSETFVVGETGVESLSQLPRELFVID